MPSALRDWLENDHREIEALLAGATSGEAFDVDSFSTARERLMRHIAIEEKIVFRSVREVEGFSTREPELLQALRNARVDHAAITTLLVPAPDAALVSELVALLEPHNVLEEDPGGIYARCDELLGEQTSELLKLARAYPPVAVREYDRAPQAIRTAAEARKKAERLRARMSW